MRNLLKQKKQSSQPRSTGISNAGQKVPREGAKKTTSTKQPKGSARSYQLIVVHSIIRSSPVVGL